VSDIDLGAASVLALNLRTKGGTVMALGHDVADDQQWGAAMDQVSRELGPLDVLVNNAGILMVQSIAETTMESFRRVAAVNTDGTFLGIKHAFAAMAERGGVIINVSSIGGMIGAANQIAYCASKGAVRLMTKCAAIEAATLGLHIRCNSIHPGVIDTPMTQAHYGFGAGLGMEEAFSSLIPSGRLGTALDVGQAAVYLASEDASYINGAELVVDGGVLAGPVRKPQAPQ
jgi:NAD(P)-dependent dehydrogenase (short-subunit alcohol dehydrogenase family)